MRKSIFEKIKAGYYVAKSYNNEKEIAVIEKIGPKVWRVFNSSGTNDFPTLLDAEIYVLHIFLIMLEKEKNHD